MKTTFTLRFCVLILVLGISMLSACYQTPQEEDYQVNVPPYDPHYSTADMAILNEVLNLPNPPYAYSFEQPKHMSSRNQAVNLNSTKATLGRVLFYDKKLSIDQSVACASCHKQDLAFADDVAFSKGANNNQTDRNSIALGSFVNIVSTYGGSVISTDNKLFWDGRAHSFHEQMRETIANPKEMGMDMIEIVSRLQGLPHYELLFRKAFGSTAAITENRIIEALGEFMFSMNASNSRLDLGLNAMRVGETKETSFSSFTIAENKGKRLFLSNCARCHGNSFNNRGLFVTEANNGLSLDYVDSGIGRLTGTPDEMGVFKVPSLRNIALTGPYMHDGRFSTLAEVIDFYNNGIQAHPNLHDHLKESDDTPKRLNLSSEEKSQLIAFLNTMTDYGFITDERFSNPFK